MIKVRLSFLRMFITKHRSIFLVASITDLGNIISRNVFFFFLNASFTSNTIL